MPAEKLGSIKSIVTQKVLPANGTNPRIEVTAISGSGTLAGAEIFQAMVTYQSEIRPDGIIYGECPNSAVVYNWDVDAEGNAVWELWEWK